MATPLQQSPFLREQRDFPSDDAKSLAVQSDRAYVEVAQAVNNRTIGIFAPGSPIVDGEIWYLAGPRSKQQGQRQVYPFTGTANIAHGITSFANVSFTRIYGTFTDGTNWYPLPNVDSAVFSNQVSIQVTPTNIVITSGGITVQSGFVVLEWIVQI